MKNMKYFDEEIKATIANVIIGVVTGYVSFLLKQPLVSLAVAVVAFICLSFLAKKAFNVKKEKKWWLSPATTFFLAWIVSWTLFYNM